jgi:hypothetical protein
MNKKNYVDDRNGIYGAIDKNNGELNNNSEVLGDL